MQWWIKGLEEYQKYQNLSFVNIKQPGKLHFPMYGMLNLATADYAPPPSQNPNMAWGNSHMKRSAMLIISLKDVRAQKFPCTDFLKTLTVGRK